MASKAQKVAGGAGVIGMILAAVFAAEGGYVNNPKDPGGETNMGITKKVAVSHGYTGPMKRLPKDLAASIYFEDYIRKPGYEPFVQLSPAIAEELVDTGVNTGPARPSRWLQVALNALNRDGRDYPALVVDGRVGKATISDYQSLQRVRGQAKACQMIIKLLDAQPAMHYVSLTHLKTFTPGWIDNRIGNVPLGHCE